MSIVGPSPPGFLVSGTHSGVGKTTVTFVVMSALSELGFDVQPFKIGPDFIDPGYHRLATGRSSINLDLWMMGLASARASYATASAGADVAVVEGMGALFDGENGTRERGSSAYFARRLGVPVVLVVDIWGMTRSTAAVLRGFVDFSPHVTIAGIVLNRAGSRKHYEMVVSSLPVALRKLVLGFLLDSENLKIPERHLGLLTVEENAGVAGMRREALERLRETLDLEELIRRFGIVKRSARRPSPGASPGRLPSQGRVRLGIARDAAFCFYYAENLRMLERAGAELVPFSPMADRALPHDLHGLYLGGGYPESFAGALSANEAVKRGILKRASAGMPIYAECGGMIYLARSLDNFDGSKTAMASVFPVAIAMDKRYLAIRYVDVHTTRRSLLGPKGTRARGQEFHQSKIVSADATSSLYQVRTSTGESFKEGFKRRNALGSYIHLHFASNPRIPVHFVSECVAYRDLTSKGALLSDGGSG